MLRRTVLALLAATLAATPALAAEEEWLVIGGDGRAVGYDRASVAKDAAGVFSVMQGGYSIAAMAAPPAIGGGSYNGLVGEVKINCKDKTLRTGATTFLSNGAPDRPLEAAPNARFTPVPPDDSRIFLVNRLCANDRLADPHLAVGRGAGVALLKQIAGQAHVANTGKKGWALALTNPAMLVAVDTSSARREGSMITETEIAWMRKDQTTNGTAWRYSQISYQYDCAAGKRRPNGPLQIYAADNSLVHEETASDAPWSALPPEGGGTMMLDMVCGGRKLLGLPVGARGAMVARLRELAILM